jgi:ubiquinone biosynthesis protein
MRATCALPSRREVRATVQPMSSAEASGIGSLGRLREISSVVARYGFGSFLEQSRLGELLGEKRPPGTEATAGSRARRLRLMLTDLGPTFVKLGQVMSTRADLLPQEVIRELSELQDQVPPFPFAEVKRTIEAGLGRDLSDAFATFDETPLASASIAQVHRASTRAGIEVIVKVQRPGIRARIEADLELLRHLGRLLESVFDETNLASPTGIVEEFEKAILGELDFTREAANVELFRRVHSGRPYVVVPHVVGHLSCATVLTLERLDGRKITDFDPERHDRATITKNLVELAFVQMFEDGLFHGDPHPGNLFVLEGSRIGLIDMGLVGRLSRSMQETLIVMCLAISLKDAGTLARLLYKIGVAKERVSLAELQTDIQQVLDRYLGADISAIDSRSLLGDLLDLAQRHRIRIPREYAVLAKASVTIEGVVRRLCPDLDVLEVAMPYAQRLLYERLNPVGRDANARRMLLQMQGFATDVPGQLAQVLMDLERGNMNVTSRRIEGELSQLVSALRFLALTVACSTMALGGFHLLDRPGSSNVLGWSLLGTASAAFAGTFAWLVLGLRPRKLRLRR